MDTTVMVLKGDGFRANTSKGVTTWTRQCLTSIGPVDVGVRRADREQTVTALTGNPYNLSPEQAVERAESGAWWQCELSAQGHTLVQIKSEDGMFALVAKVLAS